MSSLYKGAIEEYWDNEGFTPSAIAQPRQGGVRQQAFDAYEASVDWLDEEQARRALRVFESLLRRLDRDSRKYGQDGLGPDVVDELREAFSRDGCELDDQLRVRVRNATHEASSPASRVTVPHGARSITQVTRHRLFQQLAADNVEWWGDLDEITFLRRLYDLDSVPSAYPNYPSVEGDIRRHRFNNDDWDNRWIYDDDRFLLADGPDTALLRFVTETLHPEVRSDDAEVARLAGLIDRALRRDGYTVVPVAEISGYPIYGARRLTDLDRKPILHRPETSEPATPPVAKRAGENTRTGSLPSPAGAYAAVQSAARGIRKDYAMERIRMKEGGQADIFAAQHKATGVRVALKRRRSHRETPAARMRREIDVAGDLNAHPHYIPILDANPVEGWMVMPMAQGTAEDHHQRLRDPKALLELVTALIDVLQCAHAHGWLHRDVKPSNILLLDGRWRLGDWGVVRRPRGQTTKADRTRTEVGTEGFAAPELFIDAHQATPAADIYGVGRVIAWALTGSNPQMNVLLLPEPGPWRTIVRKATAPDPRSRPQAVADLYALIQRTLSEPELPLQDEAERMLHLAMNGTSKDQEAFLSFIADHPEDPDPYIATLTRLIPESAAAALIHLAAEAPGSSKL